ncbi:MAG: carbohydrate-binding domain-containing protein [Bacteroidaceae bacterium]|nr:carbohydrate-binding domain-containing protein [Bacteroidaceae bacterium]
MKRITILLSCILVSLGMAAQSQMRLWHGGESTRINLSDAQNMVFGSGGTTVSIAGTTYQTSAIDSLTMIHQVTVTFNGNSVTTSIPAAVAKDITAEADGAYLTITNNNVSNEVEFVLSGESSNGGFTYNGSYKATICLNGLTLTSQRGGAIDIQCGKRIALVLNDGTTNTLADYASGTQKACLYSKGHVEVEGTGTLNVTGNLTHAIKTKEYLQLKKSTGAINIVKAAGDAIHVGQYYLQNGGSISITSTTQADGIQAEYLTLEDDITPDPNEENNGQVIIKGGTINIEMTHEDCKAIKADDLVTITGGTFDIKASGNGSRGIQTDGSMVIGESGGTDASPTITISASGGLCTNEADVDDPHRCMGIKVDGDLTVYAGTTTVTNTGSKSRGIKVAGTYTKTGGVVNATIKN